MIEKAKINGVEYSIKTSLEDLTLGEMCEYLKIVMTHEKIGMDMADGSIDYEYVPFGKESYQFLVQKEASIVGVLSNIPDEFLERVAPSIMALIQIDTTAKDLDDSVPMIIETMRGQYECPQVLEWTFQMWCDFENLVQDDYMNFYSLLFKRSKMPYNRLHPDASTKYALMSELPAEGNIDFLYYILRTSSTIRQLYQFVYGGGSGEPAGKATREHTSRFKWLDTIVSLANNPAPIFNHQNGTLYGVRNANALDVLDYLNIKRSKEDAEYADWKAKNKHNSHN